MTDAATAKAEYVYMAKLAEQAERYDEMAKYMASVSRASASMNTSLSVEERNLLSVAFKNAVGSRRASWRIISSVEQKEISKQNMDGVRRSEQYRRTVEQELDTLCSDILQLLSDVLISKKNESGEEESQVFYHKMKGDYHRYIAEYKCDESKSSSADAARLAYQEAMQIAERGLTVTHPIRLGLALNFSVFYYEVLNQPEEACKMARKAFEDAIAELDNVSEESYKDSTLIMQLLRDNLTLWTSDDAGEGQ